MRHRHKGIFSKLGVDGVWILRNLAKFSQQLIEGFNDLCPSGLPLGQA
jgi:hypothetical protein